MDELKPCSFCRSNNVHEIIKKLRKNLAELPSDMIEYNLGYAAAISDLEHIAEEKEG